MEVSGHSRCGRIITELSPRPPRTYLRFVTSQTHAAAANRTLSSCMEKVAVPRLVKKLLVFNGPRKSNTVFTTGRHWVLS